MNERVQSDILCQHAQPKQVAVDAFQLAGQGAQVQAAPWNFNAEECLDGLAIGGGVNVRANPTDALGQFDVLIEAALFGQLFDAAGET